VTPIRSAARISRFLISGCALLPAALICPFLPAYGETPAAATPATLSITDCRNRLASLDQLVASCQSAIGAAACHSDQIGSDISVALPTGTRSIRLTWLRELFEEAASPPTKSKSPAPKTKAVADEESETDADDNPQSGKSKAKPAAPTLTVRLDQARKRLQQDQQSLDEASRSTTPDTSSQRATLTQILAAKEYHAAIAEPSLWDRIREKLANWLNRAIGALVRAGSRSKWIGATAQVVFISALLGALIWFLIRLERQGRFSPMSIHPGAGAASARDWQLWLADAQQSAQRGAWREAIHLLYWASISRLESAGLWPADRARTPREYLALLSQQSPQRTDLVALTRSFERTWYAGRSAAESDFRLAKQSAGRLGVR